MRESGRRLWRIYHAATRAASPLLRFHMAMRRQRGLEHPTRYLERFGCASTCRPHGLLLWFHAVSLGEAMAVLPIIERCIQARPCFSILMTTSTMTAFTVLEHKLPDCVICQFAPIDTPTAVDAFLRHWSPDVGIFIESELWPNLLLSASMTGMLLALLNAKISAKSLRWWSVAPASSLVMLMLSQFALIVPQNMQEALHFQLLGASSFQINFAGNLKYVLGGVRSNPRVSAEMEELLMPVSGKSVWMASSTHEGEEDVMFWIHKELAKEFPELLTILVPRHPERGSSIALSFRQKGKIVALRSRNEKVQSKTEFYIIDTVGELNYLYQFIPIAVIGGSFFPGLKGHNIAEAASAGCAVLTGPHVGHFSEMIKEMQRLSRYSIQQVSGKHQLLKELQFLLNDKKLLEMRRCAAKTVAFNLAKGVLDRVWHLLDGMILARVGQKY